MEKTYTVMISDAGGSEVYLKNVPLERAQQMVETNAYQNGFGYIGHTLWIKELKKI